MHGSQNSFFILDQTELKKQLTDNELVSLTKKITSQKTGILNGADGVLVVNNSSHPNVLGQMRVINADGSEASMCGNGLRTVSRYLAEKYHQNNFQVETLNADLRVKKYENFTEGVPAYAVEISPVRFNKEDLPFDNLGHNRLIDQYVPELYPGLKFTSIAVPNPHLISFINQKQIESNILGNLGKRLNDKNIYYPDGVNVNFAQILGKNNLFVRTYERGVGFTNACGTGMSATSLAFCLTHPEEAKFNEPITVYNPGGMVKTIVHYEKKQYWIELIGNATFTNKIEISESDLHNANFENIKITSTSEQEAYLKFINNLPHFNNVKTI
ncbi:diaminopimelate epimerase [Lactobacillus hamsteri DSM 5661 = JCM 6256]|uniref:Diaminopimelate epimerase n=1 Tax=Lactobacillus hamsteri DSM 5661 = JCM 6256 TaxID=1423754 RepID=A0A0R1YLG7_9LACO|nr:diaminopimelate epimerase [Lactobacillus hamsteri DSM 5661 = JCM 6256]